MISKTSNSLELNWQPPPSNERNGIIRLYSILLQEQETNQSLEFTANSSNITIQSLHPFYVYTSKVRAETILPGPYSESVMVQLDEDGMLSVISEIVV